MKSDRTVLIPATEVQKKFGYYQDEATRKPIFISRNGRPKTVLVSYEEFIRLKERDRQSYNIENLPDHIASDILSAKVPDELDDT